MAADLELRLPILKISCNSDEICRSEDDCRTPRSPRHMIPAAIRCPPAPKKRRSAAACKRRLQFFEVAAREEVESLFQMVQICTMANIAKLEFIALDISGKNYLSWILDADVHLISRGLGETIKEGNKETQQNRAKALIFLRHHLHDDLKTEYLTVKDPCELWTNLKERFDHQKTVVLPKARYEWIHLRLQDFKSVSAYNSDLFRIISKLKLCGEKITDNDMLEKTFSTFHASNVLLQQQYRERGFKKYSELISCLLVAEQNNELLLKNHELRPTGSAALPEANATFNHDNGRGRGNQRGRGRGRGYGRGRGRGKPNDAASSSKRQKTSNEHSSSKKEAACHRCGMNGHWSRTCRTAKHLADLYQDSIKGKDKKETNVVEFDGPLDITHLDLSDFFADPKGEDMDQLIGGGVLEDNDMVIEDNNMDIV